MLEQIKQLEAAGEWAELRRLADTLLPGDALARVHLALSTYYENIATDAAGYRVALAHGQKALDAAVPGGLMHAWAFGRVATYSADLGQYRTAEKAAQGFLAGLEANPGAGALLPWVYVALARVAAAHRDYRKALGYYAKVEAPTPAFAEQVRLNIVWAHARSGQALEAFHALPDTVEHVGVDRLHATRAAVFAAAGDWQTARLEALSALNHGRTQLFDLIETAELYLILRVAAIKAGAPDQAAVWLGHTAALLGWDQGLFNTLGLIPPAEGGVFYHQAVSRCGSSGTKRVGLRGVVG